MLTDRSHDFCLFRTDFITPFAFCLSIIYYVVAMCGIIMCSSNVCIIIVYVYNYYGIMSNDDDGGGRLALAFA